MTAAGSERHRTAIVGSRVLTTRRIVAATRTYGIATLINASAIGFYGPGDDSVDETSPPGSDFLASVCVIYEGAQFVKRVPEAPLAFHRAQMTVRSRPMGAPMEALG